MTRERLPLILAAGFLIFLIVAGAGGAWWYLFGPNEIDSAELVPGNTLLFATIPNGTAIAVAMQSSQLKKVLDAPGIKPAHDYLTQMIGEKNLDLLQTFLPNLSGQSFVAVTHYDYDKPQQIGLIAAMKPKSGLGDFGTFLQKIKTTYPDIIKQGKTGQSTVAGVEYEWIQGPGAPDKICVAQIKGWIVTTWGEAALQDWIERFEKKSTTSSLAGDVNYRTSLSRVGDDPMTLIYVNYHALVGIAQTQMAKTNPAMADYLGKKLDQIGGGALATRFENGEIVDRFSFLIPHPAQVESGMGIEPCPFETLKFTGSDTHLYWAASVNWKQYYKNVTDQALRASAEKSSIHPITPAANELTAFAQNWIHSVHLDAHKNFIDALGSEVSFQLDWDPDTTWPEVGLFVKLDKPDDFKPTIDAVVESVRQAYINSAVIHDVSSGGHNFSTLKFIQPGIMSPTITKDGPYLGIFMTESHAVRAFQRPESAGLTRNPDFNRQLGGVRAGAAQIVFMDSPYLLDRGYKTAMPYISLVSMFDKNIAAKLKDTPLPADLTWLAPVGTWSCAITPDGAGIQGYSVSGIGNQGIYLTGALGGATLAMQMMGILPKTAAPAPAAPPTTSPDPIPGVPANPPTLPPDAMPAPATTSGTPTNAEPAQPTPPVAPTNSIPDALVPPPDATPAPAH